MPLFNIKPRWKRRIDRHMKKLNKKHIKLAKYYFRNFVYPKIDDAIIRANKIGIRKIYVFVDKKEITKEEIESGHGTATSFEFVCQDIDEDYPSSVTYVAKYDMEETLNLEDLQKIIVDDYEKRHMQTMFYHPIMHFDHNYTHGVEIMWNTI